MTPPSTEVTVGERTVRISNPDRVYFSTRGETKLDLVRYYLSVGEGIVRALRERPCMLHRYPDGVDGEKIYQKRLPKGAPEWVQTVEVRFPSGRTADELCVTELADVAWAVQMSTVEFHPWHSRRADTEHPDELRIDLDPQPGTGLAECKQVAAVVLTGAGERAFCAGGDVKERAETGGYGETEWGTFEIERLHRIIRDIPKPVIAAVNGIAIGGGHVLHVICDLSIAAEHARFAQAGPRVGSFDGGYGSAYLAKMVGQQRAREIFFLGRAYSAEQMHAMGAGNEVADHAELEALALQGAREINGKSPTAQRMLKYSFNLLDDGLVGQQLFAGETTRLAYMTDEAQEGRDQFLEKRDPDWSEFPWYY